MNEAVQFSVERILANLNVMRCIRSHERRGWSVSGYETAIRNIERVTQAKQRHLTLNDLVTPPVAGSRIMTHILTIGATNTDLPDVRRVLNQSNEDDDATTAYRSAYATYKPTPSRWRWLQWLMGTSAHIGCRRLL